VLPVRGKNLDLYGIEAMLRGIEPGTYTAIILDAWYRSQPLGNSENDNAAVMRLYNLVDSITARMDCAFFCIHHSSKGDQADKATTDVGAVAGSQSRPADCHLILRPHEDAGCVVMEAVVRSFPPVEPLGLRWDSPLRMPDDSPDVGNLKGNLNIR